MEATFLARMGSGNKGVNLRLPEELIRLIQQEAVEHGHQAESGRFYNPSAVVERILRAYFDGRAKRDRP